MDWTWSDARLAALPDGDDWGSEDPDEVINVDELPGTRWDQSLDDWVVPEYQGDGGWTPSGVRTSGLLEDVDRDYEYEGWTPSVRDVGENPIQRYLPDWEEESRLVAYSPAPDPMDVTRRWKMPETKINVPGSTSHQRGLKRGELADFGQIVPLAKRIHYPEAGYPIQPYSAPQGQTEIPELEEARQTMLEDDEDIGEGQTEIVPASAAVTAEQVMPLGVLETPKETSQQLGWSLRGLAEHAIGEGSILSNFDILRQLRQARDLVAPLVAVGTNPNAANVREPPPRFKRARQMQVEARMRPGKAVRGLGRGAREVDPTTGGKRFVRDARGFDVQRRSMDPDDPPEVD